MAVKTIQSSAEIGSLLRLGNRYNGDLLDIVISERALSVGCGRVAFIAGKKLGNAVLRNRCKRVMRAAFMQYLQRERGECKTRNNDILLIANRNTAKCSSGSLCRELSKIMNSIIVPAWNLL